MTTTSVRDVGSVMNLGAAAGAPVEKNGGVSFQNVLSAQSGQRKGPEQPGAGDGTRNSVKMPRSDKPSAEKPDEKFKAADNRPVRMERNPNSMETRAPEEDLEENLEETMEKVASAVVELVQQIADTFQMPAEDVQELMTELDLQPADLLQPEKLSGLLLEAGGAQDSLALLTDEQLYSDFQTLMEQGRDLLEQTAEELQMTPEQLVRACEQARENAPEETVSQEETQMQAPEEEILPKMVVSTDAEQGRIEPETVVSTDAEQEESLPKMVVSTDAEQGRIEPETAEPQESETDKTVSESPATPETVPTENRMEPETELHKEEMQVEPEEPVRAQAVVRDDARTHEAVAAQTKAEASVRDEAETETVKREPDKANVPNQEISEQETVQAAPRKEEQTAGDNTSEDKKDGGKEHSEHGRPEGNPVLQNVRNDEFQPKMEEVRETARTWDTDTQDIMRQIMDYMRVQVKADISSLEMQLHPASLGTLQIQVVAKSGVLTANFITQNEAVKSALESQMIQLRESFEQQGVKVEAIEVTVQTHEFEQNLEQGRGRQPQESGEKKNRTRRIHLDALEGLGGSEELDEADRLTAEMMAADGNTVDYTA